MKRELLPITKEEKCIVFGKQFVLVLELCAKEKRLNATTVVRISLTEDLRKGQSANDSEIERQ